MFSPQLKSTGFRAKITIDVRPEIKIRIIWELMERLIDSLPTIASSIGSALGKFGDTPAESMLIMFSVMFAIGMLYYWLKEY